MNLKNGKKKSKIRINLTILLAGVAIYIAFGLTLFSFFFPGLSFSIRANISSPKDIISPRNDQIIDEEATNAAKERAAESVKVVHDMDPSVLEHSLKRIDQLFNIVNEVVRDKSLLTETKKAEKIRVEIGRAALAFDLEAETIKDLAGSNTAQLEEIRQGVIEITRSLLVEGVTEESIKNIQSYIKTLVERKPTDEWTRGLISEVSKFTVIQNMTVNTEQTQRNRDYARDRISPIVRNISEGEIIVRAGEKITPEMMKVIEYMGIAKNIADTRTWLGILLLPFMLLVAFFFVLYHKDQKILYNNKKLLFYTVAIIVTFVAMRFLTPISPFLSIIPLSSIILTLFVGFEVTVLTMFLIAPINAIFKSVATQPVSGTIALAFGFAFIAFFTIFQIPKVKRFTDFFKIFLFAIGSTIFASGLLALFSNLDKMNILITMAISVGSTTAQIAIALAATPFLEFITSHTTVFRLLELSDLNHPLLRKLMMEAPGSYQHSIFVGNIASVACEEIGANSLLARVGGYYHDIGKLKYPFYFIENQMGEYNPHDSLSPSLSKSIITKHVNEGEELANTYKLPEEVKGFIASHHGTSLVRFFYRKAREIDESVDEQDYRYEGHRPYTSEEAIVMLADTIESATRANQLKPNPERVDSLINRLFEEKLADEQLSDSPISLAQLTTVKQSFVNQLGAYYHKRIVYPAESQPKNEKQM